MAGEKKMMQQVKEDQEKRVVYEETRSGWQFRFQSIKIQNQKSLLYLVTNLSLVN